MDTSLLLYALPFALRVGLSWGDESVSWTDVLLSLSPLLLVAPSLLLPHWIRDHEREHVARHAVYALAFTVSVATSVRWDVVWAAEDDDYRAPLLAYLGIGVVTLWWFCLSHALENAADPVLYTHQGDVTVLPLTLVAISSFQALVPDEAVRFSRSILFFVPVVVAWATLHFVAYNGFATSRTTTHHLPGFDHLARAALVVASAHLVLLELRATPLAFQVFPFVAAVFSQAVARADAPPVLRPGRTLGSMVAAAVVGGGFGLLLSRVRFDSTASLVAPVVACVVSVLCAPPLTGKRWVLPSALYATFLTSALLAETEEETTVTWGDVVGIGGGYYASLVLVSVLAPATAWRATPPVPPSLAFADRERTPQRSLPPWSVSKMLGRCGGGEDRAVVPPSSFLRPTSPTSTCPRAFRGVWWGKGNTFPMSLIRVDHLSWKDESRAVLWLGRGVLYDRTLTGLLLRLCGLFLFEELTPLSSSWIRTDVWVLPWLRWCPSTYWLYRVSEDEMLRLVYAGDRVVWQYRLLRVVRENGTRTRFYDEFVA